MSGRPPAAARLVRAVRNCAAASVLAVSFLVFFAVEFNRDFPSGSVASTQLFPSAARIAAAAAGTVGLLGIVGIVAAIVLTAVFGRWYCAFLCPLGTLQDIASSFSGKYRRFRRSLSALRLVSLAVVFGLAAVGAMSAAAWLDPWSLFGRFVAYDVQPAARAVLRTDSPAILLGIAGSAAFAMAAILVLSFFSGRWFCGRLCPVGSVLGLLNKFAYFRLRLDQDACVACGRCSNACVASCLDGGRKVFDSSRCVHCFACVPVCPTGALRYGRESVPTRSGEALFGAGLRGPRPARPASPPASDAFLMSRTRFVAALGGGTAVLAFAAMSRKGIAVFAPGRRDILASAAPVAPPGAHSIERFLEKCTACGLCVARCPAKILRPSIGQFGVAGFFVPRLDYNVSYCQYDCTVCLDVCPSGALEKMSLERKKLTKIGDSTLVRERCVVIKNHTRCGACAEHCPTGAVRMVVGETGLPEPVFDSAICIGCGACHHACPVEPDKAISVAGLAVHETAAANGTEKMPSKTLFDAPPQNPGNDEFPF